MASYRIPGPLGRDLDPSGRDFGPYGRDFHEVHEEWVRSTVRELNKERAEYLRRCRPGPLGCYSLDMDPALSIVEEDRIKSEPEFLVLKRFCVKGVGTAKGERFATLDDYIAFRSEVFGSSEAYWQFARVSDQEFDSHATILERQLDNPWKKRREKVPNAANWYYYFYRWIRKAYLKAGTAEAKVVEAVSAGMSPALVVQLAAVRATYKISGAGSFTAGGFNPRPKKTPYRLGTISEHGKGNAVDVESGKNPDLPRPTWQKLKDFTGKRDINRSASLWHSSPKTLWNDIHELNRLFIEKMKIGAELAWNKAQIDRAAGRKDVRSEAEVKQEFKHETAGGLGLDSKFLVGFFTLDWELVKAFHDHGFTWGATFPNTIDLHHFEI